MPCRRMPSSAATFLAHVLARVDWSRDCHFHTETTIDTLDYSGSGMNAGSKLVVAARGAPRRALGRELPPALPLPAGVVTINFTETGGNVVVTLYGSLTDSSAWTPSGPTGNPSVVSTAAGMVVFGGSGDGYTAAAANSGTWTLGFGPGGGGTPASSSGSVFGILPGAYVLLVPTGYVFSSVTPTSLSSTMTFNSATFLSLGINPTATSAIFGGDTIRLTFGVPDAGPGPALALLLGGLGLRQWHSSRRSRAAA